MVAMTTSEIERLLKAVAGPADPEEYFDQAGAAKIVKLSPKWLQNVRSLEDEPGQLGPYYIKLGRRVRYRRADLDAWMLSRRQGHSA